MAKKFMYVSIGVLCLVAAYQLGAERARADWSGLGQIVGGSGSFVYDASGVIWHVHTSGWSQSSPERNLPIAASQVKLLLGAGQTSDPDFIITTSDELWAFHGYDNEWKYVGPFPGGPVAQQSRSWGSTKGQFR